MTLSFAIKAGLILLFVGSILYVHLRGKARLPVLRQFVNHSAFFAPYNALMYLFSGVPSKPYLDRSKFPELDVLKDNWQAIREEAMHLFDEGYIRAAEKNNDAGFGSFFKKGWKRFYLKWYDKALPSAELLCPKTVELVSDDESKAMALRLMQEEGILCGISCGAAMAVAVRLAETPEMQGKTIVVILPDSGERYLSSFLFSDMFSEQELHQ